MQNRISVSVMCSDLMNFGSDIKLLEELGIDMLHVDVMDGHFVPNLTFGPDFIKAMQRTAKLPLDIHLMVTDPEQVLGRFELRPGDGITVHVELDRDYSALADKVHSAGGFFGIAVNPDTPVEKLDRHLGYTDMVLLMLVHPGFAGAKMVEGIMEKVGVARKWLDSRGFPGVSISVDGSVSAERAAYMAGLGADIFVGGTAGIYMKGRRLQDTIPKFREAIHATL